MSIKHVLFFAMCMTIGYFCRLSCISRLLLMTRLMSHLLSFFEVHLSAGEGGRLWLGRALSSPADWGEESVVHVEGNWGGRGSRLG